MGGTTVIAEPIVVTAAPVVTQEVQMGTEVAQPGFSDIKPPSLAKQLSNKAASSMDRSQDGATMPPLVKLCDHFQEELGVEGATIPQVVDAASLAVGINLGRTA